MVKLKYLSNALTTRIAFMNRSIIKECLIPCSPESPHLLPKNIKVKINKSIILPVVLYACKTSSLTLYEEVKLRISENVVLKTTFVAERDEMTEGWRNVHNKELCIMYGDKKYGQNFGWKA